MKILKFIVYSLLILLGIWLCKIKNIVERCNFGYFKEKKEN